MKGEPLVLDTSDIYEILDGIRDLPVRSKQPLFSLLDDAWRLLNGERGEEAPCRGVADVVVLLRGVCNGLYPPGEERRERLG